MINNKYASLLTALLLALPLGAQANTSTSAAHISQPDSKQPVAAKAAAAQTKAQEPLKVLVHVNEQDKLDGALGNVDNLFKSLKPGETAEVEMVLNGTAPNRVSTEKPELQSFSQYLKAAYHFITGLFSSGSKPSAEPVLQRIENLSKNHNVKFAVCHNSLTGLNIKPTSIPQFIEIVPAGVTELVRKEQEGYVYLKP
ncbi:MAG: DsrE family protein [Neisseria sp.]|uniref:DsrE family protein n=1 Tax=Neisseria sp. TaxID=192066 RepID=UPI0026DB92F4|nr:DsrE family protein [Neisseria sp.]MDO4641844.1 DsrE family protein [Neisseria sp.]